MAGVVVECTQAGDRALYHVCSSRFGFSLTVVTKIQVCTAKTVSHTTRRAYYNKIIEDVAEDIAMVTKSKFPSKQNGNLDFVKHARRVTLRSDLEQRWRPSEQREDLSETAPGFV